MRNKLIVAGVGLVGYGALWGWAVTADYYERKMKSNQKLLGDIIARQQRELDSANEVLLSRIERISEAEPAFDENENEESNESNEVDEFDEAKTEEVRQELQGLIDQYTSDESSAETFVEVATNATSDFAPPFVISRDDYSWGEEGLDYEKNTLAYYPREQILLDDHNEVIEQNLIDYTVGWRNLNRFGDESHDPDVVFIRNRRMRCDFEVVREVENPPPAHILHGLDHEEYEVRKAAGTLRFRDGEG